MASLFATGKSAHPVIKATTGRSAVDSHAFTGLSSTNVPRSGANTLFVKGGTQRQNPGAHGTVHSKVQISL